MIVTGHHRSARLANRRLTALRSKYGQDYAVSAAGRFDASGEPSRRGHTFRFRITKRRKKKRAIVDHLVRIRQQKTREKRKGRERSRTRGIAADLVIPAPEGASVEELRRIAYDTLPENRKWMLDFFTKETEIEQGPKTEKTKARLRMVQLPEDWKGDYVKR